MAKKILSIVLAVMMIATLCTVAFISTSAKEAEYLNFTLNNKSYRVEVGGTFTVKKSVILPDGYSVQGGKFSISFDSTYVTPVADEDEVYTQTDLSINPTEGITKDGKSVAAAYATDKYLAKNALKAAKDNFATFTFRAEKAGNMSMEEVFDIGAFHKDDKYTTIADFADGTYNTIVSGAEEVGATEPTTTATEATTTATEATTTATEATTAATEATTAATEATTVATEADNFLTIIRGNNTYKVKVGDKFTVKKELSLPDGYAIQGGRFIVYFDPTLATPVADEDGLYAKTDLGGVTAVDNMTADGNGVSVAFAADKYLSKNVLSGSKDNFATFTFTAKAAGTLTISEAFDYGVFAAEKPNEIIEVYVNGEVKNQAIYNAANKDTIVSVPQYTTEPTTEATKPADKTGETSTVVFALIALMAIAGIAVVIARKKATK